MTDHENTPENVRPVLPRPRPPARPAWAVELRPAAARALRKLDKPVARRIVATIEALAADPRPPGATALAGTAEPTLRVRAGNYRIVYQVHDARLTVLAVLIGHRREIYRQL